jgi:predicted DNA binding CopG/RHH family protein
MIFVAITISYTKKERYGYLDRTFEDKNVQIVVRCKESFKNEVKFLAKENGLVLSNYIKYLLAQELKKAKK